MIRLALYLTVAFLAVGCPVIVSGEDEQPEQVKAFFKQSGAAKASSLKKYERKVDDTNKGLAQARKSKDKRATDVMADRKKRYDAGLAALKSGKAWPLPGFGRTIEVGTIMHDYYLMKVIQVLDGSNCLVKFGDDDLWVTGVDTSKMVDGKELRLGNGDGLLYVARTRSYTTALGAKRTVFEASPVDLETIRPYLKKGETFLPHEHD